MTDSCQAPPGSGEVLDTTKKGIVTTLIHSTDLMMLASMKPRREHNSSAPARTVQMLARWVEKPRMAASTATKASVTMINLLLLKREPEKSALANLLKAGAGILSEAVDLDSLRLGSESSSANALPRCPFAVGIVGRFRSRGPIGEIDYSRDNIDDIVTR